MDKFNLDRHWNWWRLLSILRRLLCGDNHVVKVMRLCINLIHHHAWLDDIYFSAKKIWFVKRPSNKILMRQGLIFPAFFTVIEFRDVLHGSHLIEQQAIWSQKNIILNYLLMMADAPLDNNCGKVHAFSCRNNTLCSPARLTVESRYVWLHKSVNERMNESRLSDCQQSMKVFCLARESFGFHVFFCVYLIDYHGS